MRNVEASVLPPDEQLRTRPESNPGPGGSANLDAQVCLLLRRCVPH